MKDSRLALVFRGGPEGYPAWLLQQAGPLPGSLRQVRMP